MPVRRYPMIPYIASILKVIAVILLIPFLLAVIAQFSNTFYTWTHDTSSGFAVIPAVRGFFPRLQSLVAPLLTLLLSIGTPALIWALADGFQALREIEFNTRVNARLNREGAGGRIYAVPESTTERRTTGEEPPEAR